METLKLKGNNIQGQLSVFVYPDNTYPNKGLWIAYCPELDLVGYDYGKEEARKSFEQVLNDYFEYALEHNSLEKDLLSHGWHKQEDGKLGEPAFKDLVRDGKMDNVIPVPDYSKYSISVMA